MTPRECWEKYRHLDHLLSDEDWLPATPLGVAMFEIWQAVKQAAMKDS